MKIRHAASEITRQVINYVESIKMQAMELLISVMPMALLFISIAMNFFNPRGCWSSIEVLLCIPTRSLVEFLNLFLRICSIRESY